MLEKKHNSCSVFINGLDCFNIFKHMQFKYKLVIFCYFKAIHICFVVVDTEPECLLCDIIYYIIYGVDIEQWSQQCIQCLLYITEVIIERE